MSYSICDDLIHQISCIHSDVFQKPDHGDMQHSVYMGMRCVVIMSANCRLLLQFVIKNFLKHVTFTSKMVI